MLLVDLRMGIILMKFDSSNAVDFLKLDFECAWMPIYIYQFAESKTYISLVLVMIVCLFCGYLQHLFHGHCHLSRFLSSADLSWEF